jgi:hypothetical protein
VSQEKVFIATKSPTLSTALKAFSVLLINKQTFLFMKISMPFETFPQCREREEE